ncbi:MAG TPA: alpha-amylase family glycosyl hydrolase [Microvirga sp.]|jgi:1,4-alpha-glucan branching enzyme|nr:alpha-amylase family glycosyl hydrolase [Microvirga sp.]
MSLHGLLQRLGFLVVLLALALAASCGPTGTGPARAQAGAWLDGDPATIWQRSPGFYQDEGSWYAIIHVRPDVKRVRLAGSFTNDAAGAVDLTRTPDGKFWWFKGTDQSFSRQPTAGDRYWFILDRQDGTVREIQDPAARHVESSDLRARSILTVSSDFHWTDGAWQRPGWEYYTIYQLHPRRFTDRHSGLMPLQQVREELNGDGRHDYLNRTGATAIQLLPINEFPGDLSWGYNPSFFYAVESSYGTPDQLKQLVDTAHRNGLAVILDVVMNHGGSTDNILWEVAQDHIGQGTYYDGDTVWGPMINFDNDVARHFFVQNILYLAREFHVDGFRFDFTRPIHNPNDGNIRIRGSGGGWDFLREIRAKVKALDPRIILIAEELPNTWQVTAETVDGAQGTDRHGPFDAQWADPFHDGLKAVLTGAHLDRLKPALTSFGDSWQDAVIYAESHDEVGNTDDRIARRGRDGKGWEMDQIAAAASILARGIPMLFMGQEAGEWMQFGQDDGKLPAHQPGVHDPGTGATWWDDHLPLDRYEQDAGRRKVGLWYERILRIRRGDLNRFAAGDIVLTHLHDDDGIAAFTRDGGKYLIVLNFKGRSWDRYDVGVRGRYEELANTSWPAFNLGSSPEKTRRGGAAHDIDGVPVPAYGAVVLVRWD